MPSLRQRHGPCPDHPQLRRPARIEHIQVLGLRRGIHHRRKRDIARPGSGGSGVYLKPKTTWFGTGDQRRSRSSYKSVVMLMDWSVGQVEQTFDRSGTPRAWGFEIMGKRRRLLLLFSYTSELGALVAHRLILVGSKKRSSLARRIDKEDFSTIRRTTCDG